MLTRKQIAGIGAAMQTGGIIVKTMDFDNVGADDRIGGAMLHAGAALQSAAAQESKSRKESAANAVRTVAAALNALADELAPVPE